MNYKLGKLPALVDARTLKLKTVLRKELLPPFPPSYDADVALNGIDDNFVYNNSKYGDCVIAARAHQTLRFEKFEEGIQIPITEKEVVDQYFKESYGVDVGLYLLTSIKRWRSDGWTAASKHYDIYAFGEIDWKDHDEVKHCIHLFNGINFGMRVFSKDMEQIDDNEDWELTGNDGSMEGGHGVYAYAYDEDYLSCMTWGIRQRMSWGFWDARIDEAYGIVDNRNKWLGDESPLDVEKLDNYLKEIADEPEDSDCPIANTLVNSANFIASLVNSRTRIPPPYRIR